MDWRSVGLASFCGALVILKPDVSSAQLAHPGYSGLISTPNAEVLSHGQLGLAFSWINGPETYLFPPQTNRLYAVTIGIMPGLEATFRQTQVLGWHDPEAPGVDHAFDRMFSVKYALPLPRTYPLIAIGMQDIASANFLVGVKGSRAGSTQYGQSMLYGVLGEKYANWAWHGGIGVSQKFINGLFAGISYHPVEPIDLICEWDSRGLNLGIQLLPFQSWWVKLTSINNATLSYSFGTRVAL